MTWGSSKNRMRVLKNKERDTGSRRDRLVLRSSGCFDSLEVGGMFMLTLAATFTVGGALKRGMDVGAAARSICIGDGGAGCERGQGSMAIDEPVWEGAFWWTETVGFYFYLHHCGEVEPARDVIKAVNIILDRSKAGAQCTQRRNSKKGKKLELDFRGNGSKRIKKCMKRRVIGNLARPNLHLGSNCTLTHQNSKWFTLIGRSRPLCNYMFVSVTSIKVIIKIVREPGFQNLVSIHGCQVDSGSCSGKPAACKDISEVYFQAVCKTNLITEQEWKNSRKALLIGSKCS